MIEKWLEVIFKNTPFNEIYNCSNVLRISYEEIGYKFLVKFEFIYPRRDIYLYFSNRLTVDIKYSIYEWLEHKRNLLSLYPEKMKIYSEEGVMLELERKEND